ncbi:S9 family peptidase [candidate division CSSED10-310 bacterium]|uniref:Acyl-peptide hydrolase n=1 Tax=candidate division CSSED10-310 bacterium TaxID=2855610 RepID=A0ABV6YSQ0_UNCC1
MKKNKNNLEPLLIAEDLLKLKVCGKAIISPDGQKIIVPVQWIDQKKNKYFINLWMIDLATSEEFPFTYGQHHDTQPIWSPDGQKIVFVSSREDRMQLWQIRTTGGEAQPLTQLEKGSISDPVWSPDGKWIAFLFQKKTYIGVAPTAEEQKKKKNGESKESQDDQQKWEKEEARRPKVFRRLIYKVNGAGLLSEEYQHLWVLSVQTGECRQLTSDNYDDVCATWSGDSQSIIFASNRSPEPEYNPMYYDLWRVSLSGDLFEMIKTPPGPSLSPAFSPDGQKIAYLGHDNPDMYWASDSMHLWLKDLETGEVTDLLEHEDRTTGNYLTSDLPFIDRDSPPLWGSDNQSIYYMASVKGACHLYRFDLKHGKSRQITRGPVDVRSFSFNENRNKAALTIAQLSNPADVHLYSFAKNIKHQKVSHFNAAVLKGKKIAKPQEMWFEHEDTALQGWLIKPHDFDPKKKYPLIVQIHGGPHIMYGYNFFFEFQYLVARGFLVFYMNPRGSQGYGQEFTRSIIKNWGGPDYKDIMSAVQELMKKPYVDPKRMGVTGGSYGGYMTNWIIGHTDLFAAALTQRSVVDLTSLSGTSDTVNSIQGVWGSYHWQNPALYQKLSPLTYVDRITTPLLIIHSEQDYRCPIEQAEQLYIALKHLRKKVEFVRYPDENHELSRSGSPDHRIDRVKRIGHWFEQYLMKQK